jgi:uncharacterized protein YpmS
MHFFKRYSGLFLVLLALLAASLACNLPEFVQGPPATPEPPAATQAVVEPQTSPEAAATQATENGQVTWVISEDEMTALVANQLKSQPNPVLQDPQIHLQNGQIEVTGNVQQSGITLPIKMFITVTVDDQGRPHYQVTSANLGPLPLPQSTLDQLSAQIDQALQENLSSELDQIYIDDVHIADGSMTVTGHKR